MSANEQSGPRRRPMSASERGSPIRGWRGTGTMSANDHSAHGDGPIRAPRGEGTMDTRRVPEETLEETVERLLVYF